MKPSISPMKRVIRSLNSCVTFYDNALSKIHSAALRKTFEKNKADHLASIERLQSFVVAEDEPKEEGQAVGIDLQNGFAAFSAAIKVDADLAYVEALTNAEKGILADIDAVVEPGVHDETRKALMIVRVHTQKTYDRIIGFQEELNRKAS